jgi:S1-C subfamily serine protease
MRGRLPRELSGGNLGYMKKAIVLTLFGLAFLPLSASAAWWNPFTWTRTVFTENGSMGISSTSATSSDRDLSLMPTVDDLYKRIAELEMKLDRTRADLEKAQKGSGASVPVSAEVAAAPAAKASGSLPEKELLAKVRPAIVLVEGAFGTASGAIIDAQGRILTNFRVIGTSTEATVTLSSGVKKKADVIGLEESNDLAILQLADKKSSAYVTPNYGAGVSTGNAVYIFGFPGSQSAGSAFVTATVTEKNSSSVRVTSTEKPLDNGGALVTGKGSLIGLPNPSTCKVLEEMRNCLTYAVTTNLFPTRIPVLVSGLRLYKDKKNRTVEEELFHGYVEGLYNSVSQIESVRTAVESVTGKNSFDYFNTKLADDTEGKIPKLYALKLKTAAQNIAKGYDTLKSASYAFRISLINDSALALRLDPYQQKAIEKLVADNDARLKSHEALVNLWTKKKNEYDTYIARPSEATNDYLMAEGVAVEAAARRLEKERQTMLDGLSGDVRGAF